MFSSSSLCFGFHVCLSLLWSQLLCNVIYISRISFFCVWTSVCSAPFVEGAVLTSVYVYGDFVKYSVAEAARTDVGSSILFSMSFFSYCSRLFLLLYLCDLKICHGNPSSIFFFFAQDCGYLESFVVPY